MVVAGLPAALLVVPAQAQAPGLAMLSGLDEGRWTVRYRDGSASQSICVRNGRELIQLRHRGNNCRRYVVEDGKAQVTVQYTCPGNDYGRTSIRRENSGLVQIESQGLANGLPFQFSAEARRSGSCK